MNRIAELKGIIEKAQAALTIREREENAKAHAHLIGKCYEGGGLYYRVLGVNPEDGYLRIHRFGQDATGVYFGCYGHAMEAHSLNALHEIGQRESDRAWKRFLKTLQSWE